MGSNPIVSAIFSCKYLIYLIFSEALFPAPHSAPHDYSGGRMANSRVFTPIDVPGGTVRGKSACRAGCLPYPPRHDQACNLPLLQTSPEIIRLAVVIDVRYPLLLRNAEDLRHKRDVGRWLNNRVESSQQSFRRRERAMLRFRLM